MVKGAPCAFPNLGFWDLRSGFTDGNAGTTVGGSDASWASGAADEATCASNWAADGRARDEARCANDRPLTVTVETTSANEVLELPILDPDRRATNPEDAETEINHGFTVHWDDDYEPGHAGNVVYSNYTAASAFLDWRQTPAHTYASAGTYRVVVRGRISGFRDLDKLYNGIDDSGSTENDDAIRFKNAITAVHSVGAAPKGTNPIPIV
eukprot:g5573.t1